MPPTTSGKAHEQANSAISSTLTELYDSVTGIKPSSSSHLHRLMDKAMHMDDGEASELSEDDDALLEDDGLSSSSEEEFEDGMGTDVLADHRHASRSPERMTTLSEDDPKTAVPPPKQSSGVGDQVPKTAGLLTPAHVSHHAPARQTSLPGYFDKTGGHPDHGAATPGSSIPPTPGAMTPGGSKRRPIFKRQRSQASSRKSTKDFNFDANKGKDTLGIVVMEILSASDLPRIKNCEIASMHLVVVDVPLALRLGYDMDPFVVIAFGQKVFRTRVIRHSLNPTWGEKLLFHVRRHEANYTIGFSVLDWDKASARDRSSN